MRKFVLIILGLMLTMSVFAQEDNKEKGVFQVVDDMPVYPGGDMTLRNDIASLVKYPVVAKENGIQGKVYVSFVVNKEGKIEDAKIARGVDPSIDKEALRVINALDKTWKPGKEDGEPVKVSYTVPIKFALGEDKSDEKKTFYGEGENKVYYIVDDMPQFPGGDEALRKYIANAVTYPDLAQKNGIAGKVYISFVVEKDGTVGNARVARGVDPSLDKEALRVVKALPKWKPGVEKGKPVPVEYTVPINFALQ